MASQWFVFVFFIFFSYFPFPIFVKLHFHSNCDCISCISALVSKNGKGNPLQCVCNGWQPTQREWHKITKQFESNGLAVFVQPDQPISTCCFFKLQKLVDVFPNSTSITSVHSVYSDYSLRQGAAKSKRRGFKGSWRSVEDFRRSQRSTTEKPLCWLYWFVLSCPSCSFETSKHAFFELCRTSRIFFRIRASPWTKARFSAFSSISVRWIPLMTRPDLSASQALQFQQGNAGYTWLAD